MADGIGLTQGLNSIVRLKDKNGRDVSIAGDHNLSVRQNDVYTIEVNGWNAMRDPVKVNISASGSFTCSGNVNGSIYSKRAIGASIGSISGRSIQKSTVSYKLSAKQVSSAKCSGGGNFTPDTGTVYVYVASTTKSLGTVTQTIRFYYGY